MKCVREPNSQTIKRVTDEEAKALIAKGWAYCPKSEWKAQR